jgi:hypothetical protein
VMLTPGPRRISRMRITADLNVSTEVMMGVSYCVDYAYGVEFRGSCQFLTNLFQKNGLIF